MGQLIDGGWSSEDRVLNAADGSFNRPESPWRRFVSADGCSGFKAEPDRYHLYVNVGCPWAYRAVLVRALKGLENVISMSCTNPAMGVQGWTFLGADGATTDEWGRSDLDFYPEPLRAEIDALSSTIYETVNNGVYRCGFARSQSAYEAAYDALFATLDELDARLARRRYLLGDQVTEADWRLFSTLLRFDLAYYGAFKCNRQRLVDYANLWPYARDLYQYPGVADTVDFEAFKTIYWSRSGIIPKGPQIDWAAPHQRNCEAGTPEIAAR